MNGEMPESSRSWRFLTAIAVVLAYGIMIGSAFAVRPNLGTWFVFSAFSGHDGITFFAVATEPFADHPTFEKHRYLRFAYPLMASICARGLDQVVPSAWIAPEVLMQGHGLVPRFYLFCAVALVVLNLLFLGLATSSLCQWLEPRCSRPYLFAFLLLVPNFVLASTMPRSLTEPLVLLTIFRLQLAWQRSAWSLEVFFWLVFGPFVKEYLLVLPVVWGLVQFVSPDRQDLNCSLSDLGKSLMDPKRWGTAVIAMLLTLPYFVYWALLAHRVGESFLSLKGSHASSNVGLPFVGFLQGIWQILTEPVNFVNKSSLAVVETLGYQALHLICYLMILLIFYVFAPRAFLLGYQPRWQAAVHLLLLGLTLTFSAKVTHSVGDLGRVLAASPAFWTVAALRLNHLGWRIAWSVVGSALFLAQWLRLLVIARQGGFEITDSLKMIGLN